MDRLSIEDSCKYLLSYIVIYLSSLKRIEAKWKHLSHFAKKKLKMIILLLIYCLAFIDVDKLVNRLGSNSTYTKV